tara:strand:+ start:64 stop:378 length:315 start_codon:yes stop_codon:yes gene_type:complete
MPYVNRQNIAVTTPVELVPAGQNLSRINSIIFTNTHASNSVSISLKLYNATNGLTTHIVKNTAIPAGVSLELDTSRIVMDFSLNQDNLTVTASTTGGLDVIINS